TSVPMLAARGTASSLAKLLSNRDAAAMTAIKFRNTEQRLSSAIAEARASLQGETVTLRQLLAAVGEQGILVACALMASPFLLPVTVPLMSWIFGIPMLLIGTAVVLNRLPWMPARVVDRELPGDTIRLVMDKVVGWAERVEHLIKPRWLSLSSTSVINVLNGLLILHNVVLLMAPLPLVPFANTLPAMAIVLLAIGMAERDGLVIVLGYLMTLVSTLYIGVLMALVILLGLNFDTALETLRGWWG
ncbi:MAG: exopolysaccharide biosynthesis protein, partial [Steroidobacteraceae bacterium]